MADEFDQQLAKVKAARGGTGPAKSEPGLGVTSFEPGLKFAPLPSVPASPEMGSGLRAARALAIALSGTFGGPQNALNIAQQFTLEDQQARARVQEDFQSRIELAMQQRRDTIVQAQDADNQAQRKQADQQLDLARKGEARAAQGQAFNQELDILGAMFRQKEQELAAARAAGEDGARLMTDLNMIQELRMLKANAERNVLKPPPIDNQAVYLRASKEKRTDFDKVASEMRAEQVADYQSRLAAVASQYSGPALQKIRDAAHPKVQPLLDIMIGSTADLVEGNPGGQGLASGAAAEVLRISPEELEKADQANAAQYLAEGRVPNFEAGLDLAVRLRNSKTEPNGWNLPPMDSFPRGGSTGFMDSILRGPQQAGPGKSKAQLEAELRKKKQILESSGSVMPKAKADALRRDIAALEALVAVK